MFLEHLCYIDFYVYILWYWNMDIKEVISQLDERELQALYRLIIGIRLLGGKEDSKDRLLELWRQFIELSSNHFRSRWYL